jgi:hypothetical protein
LHTSHVPDKCDRQQSDRRQHGTYEGEEQLDREQRRDDEKGYRRGFKVSSFA